jgi:hypothetical protein
MTPKASFWPRLYLPLLCINYWAERERGRWRIMNGKEETTKQREKKMAHKMHRQLMLAKM